MAPFAKAARIVLAADRLCVIDIPLNVVCPGNDGLHLARVPGRETGAGPGACPVPPPFPLFRAAYGRLPAVPPTTSATARGRADEEPYEPENQHDHGYPPESLDRETGTEENQGEKENE
ncbi:hypothetical protein GCM10010504_57040 [Streptomyces griseus]|nr:hypothetical protein GCM10010504_57040 [Streptomyces griseus]